MTGWDVPTAVLTTAIVGLALAVVAHLGQSAARAVGSAGRAVGSADRAVGNAGQVMDSVAQEA